MTLHYMTFRYAAYTCVLIHACNSLHVSARTHVKVFFGKTWCTFFLFLAPMAKAPGPGVCSVAAREGNRAGPSGAWSPKEAALRGGRDREERRGPVRGILIKGFFCKGSL